MANILTLPITAAVTAQVGAVMKLNSAPRNLTVQFNFTYGSGGTSVSAYLQTSLDNGATWADIANFGATTANLRMGINLNGQTTKTTQLALTDGTLTANTAVDGLLGSLYRVKYTTVGIYAGGTVLAVDLQSDEISVWP